MLARVAIALWMLGSVGCESSVCFGDSCSCYGDPEAPNANAGCSKCTPDRVCETLAERVEECGLVWHGELSTCEARVRAEHTCMESADTTPCDVLSVACPTGEGSCFAELVTTGMTACDSGISSGSIVECPSQRCVFGECVECLPASDWSCPTGKTCTADGKCVPRCDTDADCGPLSSCFAHECDPLLGTPCSGPLACGTQFCEQLSGQPQPICTKGCTSTCAPGSFCACPEGFLCSGGFCAPR